MGFSFVIEEDEDRTIPEDTILRAKLIDIQQRDINWKDRTTGEAKSTTLQEFWFEIEQTDTVDERFVGRRVKGSVNAKMTPSSKGYKWIEALLGSKPGVGKKLDTDDLLGLSADVLIAHRKGNKDGRIFEEVDQVMNPDADPWSAAGGEWGGDGTPPF